MADGSMLPLTERWYTKLLLWSVGLGSAGGLIALAYSGSTGYVIDRLFGDPTPEAWAGAWWWMIVVPVGALIVTWLRKLWRVPDDVPGAIALAANGWVEPASAIPWVLISVVSLMAGASLGPSFGIVVAGGGLGALLHRRINGSETGDPASQYALTGMSAGLGAVFSAPLFASILSSELSSTPKRSYVQAFIPQFSAATVGYVVFFGVTGTVMLDAFDVDAPYEFERIDLAYGVLLGQFAIVALIVFAAVGRVVGAVSDRLPDVWIRAPLFGLVVGAIAYALPLTAAGGSAQLSYTTATIGTVASGVLFLTLVGKMFAVVLSLKAGFLGGTVFPMLFVGGTAGVLVYQVFPDIPAALAVAAMIASVPGATIGAPVSFILIGAAGVGVGPEAVGPIGIAVLTSYTTNSLIHLWLAKRSPSPDPTPHQDRGGAS